jgi:hypothetical protein
VPLVRPVLQEILEQLVLLELSVLLVRLDQRVLQEQLVLKVLPELPLYLIPQVRSNLAYISYRVLSR